MKLVELQFYIESFKERHFFKANFFFDMQEQRKITKRIVIDMRSKTNLVEKTVLSLKIPYKLTLDQQELAKKINETNPYETLRYKEKHSVKTSFDSDEEEEEEEKKGGPTIPAKAVDLRAKNPYFYEAFGLVYKVLFTNTGLRVYVDINSLSPIDQAQ
jgi:hypothetical protein